ncbi:MAG: 6-phosphogluconolactonase [Pseudomonadota bacterium]
MSQLPETKVFETREAAAAETARLLAGALASALLERPRVSFMASGGSSPGAAYEMLSAEPLDWDRVTVGLVDERWVDPEDAASNEALVRRTLLKNDAATATFLPMKTDAASPADAAAVVDARYAGAPRPFDAVLLGMGLDGHTASWFPGARGLEAMLDPAGSNIVAAIDAAGSPIARDHPLRLTLTLPALKDARRSVLLIYGAEKRSVLEAAMDGRAADLPVRRLIEYSTGGLSVVWAP